MIKDEKGQSLVEFALLLPILLLTVCGIFDLGRVMYGYLHLNLVAQEAVRMGGLGKTDVEIAAYAKKGIQLGNKEQLQVSVSPAYTARRSGDYVTVSLTYPLHYITPLISLALPPPVITADSTIRVE